MKIKNARITPIVIASFLALLSGSMIFEELFQWLLQQSLLSLIYILVFISSTIYCIRYFKKIHSTNESIKEVATSIAAGDNILQKKIEDHLGKKYSL